MKKSMFGLALVAAATGAWIGGAFAQDLTGTLKKIADTGEIVVSHRDASIPFSYLDGSQKPVGYAFELCNLVADAIKAKIKKPNTKIHYALVSSATRIPLLLNGTIDLECGSTTNTAERERQVSFSNTYFVASNRILVKKSSKIKSLDDLRGKTVASAAGTTNIKQITEINAEKKLGMNIVAGKDLAEAFLLLESDRASALVMDDILLSSLSASSRAPKDYEIIGDPLSFEAYAPMVRREDAPFKAAVDEAMARLLTGGKAEELYKTWFQGPIPPNNINLDLAMSPSLKRAMANPTDSNSSSAYR